MISVLVALFAVGAAHDAPDEHDPPSVRPLRGDAQRSADATGDAYHDDPDTARMLAFQDGDEDAFAELFESHIRPVTAVFYRYTLDRPSAEDLAQEAFIRVYKARDRYEPRAKFTTWLYRIVTNLALNHTRDRKKRRHRPLATTSDSSDALTVVDARDPNPVDPDAGLAHDELAEAMADALDALPDTQRLALILNKYEDKSYQEIADTLATTTKAVKSLLARARENMRQKLGPYWAKHGSEG